MIVLPLGLGTKLKHWPLVTVAISLVWILVATVDHSETRIFGEIFGVASVTGVRDRARELFIDYCKSRHGATADCAKYSILVWTGYPGKGELPAGAGFDDEADDDDEPGQVFFTRMEAEHTVAAKLRKDLLHCDDERKCFVYKDIVWRFLDQTHRHAKKFAALASFKPYKAAMRAYRLRLNDVCAENSCLVQGNITPAALVAAQLRHGGFLHLLGNILVFIVFGIYAEQRTGRLLYLFTVVAGGTLGMGVHAAFFSSGDTIALGGSANVSAAMGMFFVFFFRQNMRFRCVLPLHESNCGKTLLRKPHFGTTFAAPVAYAFPLVYVLSDVIGGLDSGFDSLSSGNVAHFAHLTGFAFGAAIAYAVTRLRPLPLPFIFEAEMDDMRALEASRDPAEALARAQAMTRYNPDNVHAMEVGCALFLRWAAVAAPNEDAALFDRGRTFLMEHLPTVCAVNVRKDELRYACRLLSQVPLYLPYTTYLGRLGQVSSLRLADYALLAGHPILSLRLYDYYLTKFPGVRQRPAVEATVLNALACLPATAENMRAMAAFSQHHPESSLVPMVAAWAREKRSA